MALQPKEKKLLKILAAVVVVGGFIMYRSSRPAEIPVTEADPEKTAEIKAKKNAKTSTAKARTASGDSAAPARSGGGGSASRAVAPTISTISLTEFESHKTPDSCWVLIDGRVYDITDYLKNSPEPKEIAPYCGTFAFEEGYLNEIATTKNAIIEKANLKGTIG